MAGPGIGLLDGCAQRAAGQRGIANAVTGIAVCGIAGIVDVERKGQGRGGSEHRRYTGDDQSD